MFQIWSSLLVPSSPTTHHPCTAASSHAYPYRPSFALGLYNSGGSYCVISFVLPLPVLLASHSLFARKAPDSSSLCVTVMAYEGSLSTSENNKDAAQPPCAPPLEGSEIQWALENNNFTLNVFLTVLSCLGVLPFHTSWVNFFFHLDEFSVDILLPSDAH